MKKWFLVAAAFSSWVVPGSRDLQAQFLPASSHAIFRFAHLTDGGPQGDRWRTVFRIVNPTAMVNLSVSGTLWFFDPQGNPLPLDFGNGAVTSLQLSIPAQGAIQVQTTGASPANRTGSVIGVLDSPVLAVEEFQNWRNGVFVNGASINASGAAYRFQTYADKYTGIAVVNPTLSTISCSGTFLDGVGSNLGSNSVTLPGFGQTSFTLGNILSIPTGAPGSYFLNCQNNPFEALAIAGDSRGITSSMPPGDYGLPSDKYGMIWNAFYLLVKALNNTPTFEVGHPELQILQDPIINAQFDQTTNTVKIQLALVELLADSPSEVAWVIGHELGHVHQHLTGSTTFDTNVELDADQFSMAGLLLTGYDAYAAGGALGKLMMALRSTGLVAQLFENSYDPHTSFPNRMDQIMNQIQTLCSLPQAGSVCTLEHNLFHPHMPKTSTPLLTEAPPSENVKIQAVP